MENTYTRRVDRDPRLEDGKRRRRPGEGFLGVDSSKVVVVVGVVCVVGGSQTRAQTRVKFQRRRGEKGGQRGLLGDSGPSGMETLPGSPCAILAASRQMDRQTGWRSPPGSVDVRGPSAHDPRKGQQWRRQRGLSITSIGLGGRGCWSEARVLGPWQHADRARKGCFFRLGNIHCSLVSSARWQPLRIVFDRL
jgi:hypothetical protein